MAVYKTDANKKLVKTAGGLSAGQTYSTTERFTGNYWIDGKPIYRKTLVFTGNYTGLSVNLNHNISNVDTIFIDQSYSFLNNKSDYSTFLPVSYAYPTIENIIGCFVDSTKIGLRIGSNQTIYRVVITVNYTKTV